MSWNYRIIHHDMDADEAKHWLGLHEVFYEDGVVAEWTKDAVDFVCGLDEGPEGLVLSLEQALRDARGQPVLRESELLSGWSKNARPWQLLGCGAVSMGLEVYHAYPRTAVALLCRCEPLVMDHIASSPP